MLGEGQLTDVLFYCSWVRVWREALGVKILVSNDRERGDCLQTQASFSNGISAEKQEGMRSGKGKIGKFDTILTNSETPDEISLSL